VFEVYVPRARLGKGLLHEHHLVTDGFVPVDGQQFCHRALLPMVAGWTAGLSSAGRHEPFHGPLTFAAKAVRWPHAPSAVDAVTAAPVRLLGRGARH
jgi:hypothetical protein